ncbi:MAG TPA: hypothetical protein VII38_10745 [Polyangia bacterium]
MRTPRQALLLALSLAAFGCGSSSNPANNPDSGNGNPMTDGGAPLGDGGTPLPSLVSVSGDVVDFQTGAPLASAQVSTIGVTPAPTVAITTSSFMLTGVEPFSVFYVIASSPPDYPSTYQTALTVNASDLTGVQAEAVKATYLSSLSGAFAATTSADHGTLIVQVLDPTGKPEANVPAAALAPTGTTGAKGPYFLDANKQPAPALTATSASGYAVYFEVPAGSVSFASAGGYTVTGTAAPIGAGLTTLAAIEAAPGAPSTTPPKNVSFSTQIVPIFMRRGCVNCHSGNGPGRDLGGLTLDASIVIDYRELTQEISPNFKTTRVNLADPAKSLVLTMPSYENPPDAHPTVVFPSSADPDYQLLLTWITEGAKDN